MNTVEVVDGVKRKIEEYAEGGSPEKRRKEELDLQSKTVASPGSKINTKGREIRLEQNRKAARESRRRKKVMIEELQRSVIFFSRANGTLKMQNDELTRALMQAQMQVNAIESHKESTKSAPAPAPSSKAPADDKRGVHALANAMVTQAMYEALGQYTSTSDAAKAKAAGTTDVKTEVNSTSAASSTQPPIPPMQPGATMQAMANFQQAAAAAMQCAMGQMQTVPGVNVHQFATAPVGVSAQQAYTDTMTALAMQQAAASAAGMMHHGMFLQPLLPHWFQQTTLEKPGTKPSNL